MELQLEIPSCKDTHLLKFDAKSANEPDFSILSLAYGQITLVKMDLKNEFKGWVTALMGFHFKSIQTEFLNSVWFIIIEKIVTNHFKVEA